MTANPPAATTASHWPVDALPAGTRLGEFEIVALLGVGGFGVVYQAFDHSLLRFVAIKEYMPAALAVRSGGQSLRVRTAADESSFRAGLESFVGEARLLAQFDHPSLVRVFRFWQEHHTAYMVMPLYSGMTLAQARTHMRAPPSEAWMRKLLWSVASGLRVLHDSGTLHRDISPDNIFLQDSGPPVLLDLGAARHAIGDSGRHHTAVLKVNYAPIEQYSDAASDLQQGPWSDLYSLGATVHGCLCNDAPLPATLRSIRDRMVPFSRVARTVHKQFGVEYSPNFVRTISRCLALHPQKRPQSIEEFLQALEMTSAPADLEHFDFRAELGSNWVEPADKDAPGVAASVIDLSALSQPLHSAPEPVRRAIVVAPAGPDGAELPAAAEGMAFAETVVQDWNETAFAQTRDASQAAERPPARSQRMDAGTARAERRAPAAGGVAGAAIRSARGPGRWLAWVATTLLVLVLAAFLWQRGQAPKPPRTPEHEILTEAPEPPPAPLQAQAPQAAPEDEAPAEEAAAEPTPPPAPAAPRPRAQARKVVEELPPAPAPPPAPVPVAVLPEPRPAPEPAPRRVAGPEEACASSNFLARPMCIHQQCQQAAMAGHPTCVAERQRREEEARRRQLYSQ